MGATMADRNLTSSPVEPRSGPTLDDLIAAEREWFGVSRAKDGAAQHAHRSQLETFRFWTPNTSALTWCIVADIDHSDGELRALSCPVTPSWVVVNPVSGHAQAGWVIEPVSHGEQSRARPQQYLAAVASAITNTVGGDPSFARARCRNPFFIGASTWWGNISPRPLGELKAALVAADKWRPTNYGTGEGGALGAESWPQTIAEGERDVTVFTLARRANDPETAVYELARRCSPPLPDSQVEKLARQAAKYKTRTPQRRGGSGGSWEALSVAQAERGRRSWRDDHGAMRAPSQARAEAMSRGRAAANTVRAAEASMRAAELAERVAPLREKGQSWRAISADLGVSVRALRRAVAGVAGQEPSGTSPINPTDPSSTSTDEIPPAPAPTSIAQLRPLGSPEPPLPTNHSAPSLSVSSAHLSVPGRSSPPLPPPPLAPSS